MGIEMNFNVRIAAARTINLCAPIAMANDSKSWQALESEEPESDINYSKRTTETFHTFLGLAFAECFVLVEYDALTPELQIRENFLLFSVEVIVVMGLRHPFQKLCFAKASTGLPEVLLAACGAHLCCYDFQKGLVARWPVSEDNEDDLSDYEAEQPNGNDDGERPTKRQRLSGHEESLPSRHESEESVEIISERAKGQRRKPKPTVEPKLPDVSHILATESGRHIVVVTADDKCIRVLERRKDGRLRSISERLTTFRSLRLQILTSYQMHAQAPLCHCFDQGRKNNRGW